jgi:hypothetical protein
MYEQPSFSLNLFVPVSSCRWCMSRSPGSHITSQSEQWNKKIHTKLCRGATGRWGLQESVDTEAYVKSVDDKFDEILKHLTTGKRVPLCSTTLGEARYAPGHSRILLSQDDYWQPSAGVSSAL